MTPAAFLQLMAASARAEAPLPVRFACLALAAAQGPRPANTADQDDRGDPADLVAQADLVDALCQRLRVPTACRELALLLLRCGGQVMAARRWGAEPTVQFLLACDALRKPQRFQSMLDAVQLLAAADPVGAQVAEAAATHLQDMLARAQAVDTGQAALQAQASGLQGPAIGLWIQQARVAALARAMACEE